ARPQADGLRARGRPGRDARPAHRDRVHGPPLRRRGGRRRPRPPARLAPHPAEQGRSHLPVLLHHLRPQAGRGRGRAWPL
ncbi:MAG: hypothetical protein AVDCRST_MAG04-1465, partial [uncultured Acetobacteraceae bacterium]